MWKIPLFTMLLATMFLGGCNWGNKAVEETPMNDLGNDIRRGVDDVEDAVTPDTNKDVYDRDVNGVHKDDAVIEESVAPQVTNPNPNVDVNGTNGVIKEDVVEDQVEVRERENVNTR